MLPIELQFRKEGTVHGRQAGQLRRIQRALCLQPGDLALQLHDVAL